MHRRMKVFVPAPFTREVDTNQRSVVTRCGKESISVVLVKTVQSQRYQKLPSLSISVAIQLSSVSAVTSQPALL